MKTTDPTSMGSRIAAHRQRLGLTQDQLAQRIGVSPQAVSKWENDLSCPDISVLPQLAEIFGVSTDELLGIAPKAQPVYQGEIVSDDKQDDDKEKRGVYIDLDLDGARWGAIGFALWILSLGAMLLAGNLLKLPFGFWTAAWTTGLVVLGLGSLRKHWNLFGACLTLSGVYFILDNLQVLPFTLSWKLVFPVLLLVWGLSLLVDALTRKRRGKKHKEHKIHVNTAAAGGASTSSVSADGYLKYDQSFGENHYVVRTPEFKGGEVSVSFGDYSIDLTECLRVADGCALDLTCSFGELTLLVPRRFRVDLDSSKAFASLDIVGAPDPEPQGVIEADASVSFGEITIRYI